MASKTNKSKSWRDVLPIHPAAEMFPLMSEAELRELGQDIKKNGLIHEVVLCRSKEGGQMCLLDGRNRLDAMELLGLRIFVAEDQLVENLYIELDDDDEDPFGFVIGANIHRRHLTAEQRRDLIKKLIMQQPDKSDRQIAEQTKVDHKTVGKVRTDMEGRGEIPHVATRTDSKGRKQPATKPKPPADPYIAAAVERAVASSKANKRRQEAAAAGNGADPEQSAAQRRAGVRIDSGPIEATDRLRDVPQTKWHDLMLARRQFLEIHLSSDCRRLVEFVNDAKAMHAPLGFASPEQMIHDGLGLLPEEIKLAVEWLRLRPPPNEPVALDPTIAIDQATTNGAPPPAEPLGIPEFLRRAAS